MTPEQIKEARQTLGLTQSHMAVLTGGKPDNALWRKYESGAKPLPQMKLIILSEMAAGMPEFTINTNFEDSVHWVEHTRYPRLKWAVDCVPEGEQLTPLSTPPNGFDAAYDALTNRAWAAWETFHQIGLDDQIEDDNI